VRRRQRGPRLAHSHVPMGVHSVARLERRQAVLREGRRSGRNSKLQSPNREGAARARACTRSSDMGEDSGPGSVRSKLDEATRSWRSAQGCSGVVRDQLCRPAWRDSWREQLPEPAFPLQSDESSPCLQNRGLQVRVLPALSSRSCENAEAERIRNPGSKPLDGGPHWPAAGPHRRPSQPSGTTHD
jgi:hypothetical protein